MRWTATDCSSSPKKFSRLTRFHWPCNRSFVNWRPSFGKFQGQNCFWIRPWDLKNLEYFIVNEAHNFGCNVLVSHSEWLSFYQKKKNCPWDQNSLENFIESNTKWLSFFQGQKWEPLVQNPKLCVFTVIKVLGIKRTLDISLQVDFMNLKVTLSGSQPFLIRNWAPFIQNKK